jgi:hypothetical protein
MDDKTKALVAAQLAGGLLAKGMYASQDEELAAKLFYEIVKQLDEQSPKGTSLFG